MHYMLLKDVSRQTYRWKILVRLARIWEFRDQQTGSILYEVGFVAVDKQGGTMEGSIPNNRVDQFKDIIKEGSVYAIEQFVLSDAKKNYRSVQHPYRIRFTQRTKIVEILAIPENFPTYAYDAKPFDVLSTRMNDNTLLSDVVGLVTVVTDMSIAPSTQQNKRQVFITNGSDRVVVTLWGSHAESFQAEDIKLQSERRPIIVLFVGMTVSQFSGLLAFKSTSVTKWYINIPIPEITAIRQTLMDQSYRVEEQASSRAKAEPTNTTLAALCLYDLYKITYAGTDSVTAGTEDSPIGHFTFLGQEGVSLVGRDEILLVPDPLFPPVATPRCLFEPIGKKYNLTAELTDNSLDSDNLCFQVNASEEIRTAVAPSEPTASAPVSLTTRSDLSAGILHPTTPAASDMQLPPRALAVSTLEGEPSLADTPTTGSPRDRETVHASLESTPAGAVEKAKILSGARKRETTPPAWSTAKKTRAGKLSTARQLAFDSETTLPGSSSPRDVSE